MLAIWALGAPGPVIEAAYATHCEYQRPAFPSPEPIDNHNYHKYLGDECYYAGYLNFFTSKLFQKGLTGCLEEYISSAESDFGAGTPAMLSRFVGGVFHPLIHVGYGAEFSLIGVSAEGSAMTAVHSSSSDLLPRDWFPDVVSESSIKGGNLALNMLVAQ